MSNLLFAIKQAALEAVRETEPVKILYGTVESASPLLMRLDQKTLLDEDFLVIMDGFPALQNGDKVVLLRQEGGSEYLVLGKRKGAADDT